MPRDVTPAAIHWSDIRSSSQDLRTVEGNRLIQLWQYRYPTGFRAPQFWQTTTQSSAFEVSCCTFRALTAIAGWEWRRRRRRGSTKKYPKTSSTPIATRAILVSSETVIADIHWRTERTSSVSISSRSESFNMTSCTGTIRAIVRQWYLR